MTADILPLHQGTDPDAAYVLARIAIIDDCENDIVNRREEQRVAMMESGLRLIEVHKIRSKKAPKANVTDLTKSVTLRGTWDAWLSDNGINKMKAYRHMKFTRQTGPERAEARRTESTKRAMRAKPFRRGWINLLVERLGMTHGSLRDKKAQIETVIGKSVPSEFTDPAEAEAFVLAYVAAFPSTVVKKPELSETAQQKLDREIARRIAELEDEFEKAVFAEADRRLPEITADRQRTIEENNEETARYRMLNDGIKKAITAEDYRFLIQVVHPDKNPPEYKERYERAFRIVRQLQDYVEALEARHARR